MKLQLNIGKPFYAPLQAHFLVLVLEANAALKGPSGGIIKHKFTVLVMEVETDAN